MKPIISFDEFSKMDLRVGRVVKCEPKEDTDKLLRLTIDFGEEGTRTILTGLKMFYTPEDFEDKLFIFILNLEPRKMMGEQSQGMILCAESEKPIPLIPSVDVPPGSTIR